MITNFKMPLGENERYLCGIYIVSNYEIPGGAGLICFPVHLFFTTEQNSKTIILKALNSVGKLCKLNLTSANFKETKSSSIKYNSKLSGSITKATACLVIGNPRFDKVTRVRTQPAYIISMFVDDKGGTELFMHTIGFQPDLKSKKPPEQICVMDCYLKRYNYNHKQIKNLSQVAMGLYKYELRIYRFCNNVTYEEILNIPKVGFGGVCGEFKIIKLLKVVKINAVAFNERSNSMLCEASDRIHIDNFVKDPNQATIIHKKYKNLKVTAIKASFNWHSKNMVCVWQYENGAIEVYQDGHYGARFNISNKNKICDIEWHGILLPDSVGKYSNVFTIGDKLAIARKSGGYDVWSLDPNKIICSKKMVGYHIERLSYCSLSGHLSVVCSKEKSNSQRSERIEFMCNNMDDKRYRQIKCASNTESIKYPRIFDYL